MVTSPLYTYPNRTFQIHNHSLDSSLRHNTFALRHKTLWFRYYYSPPRQIHISTTVTLPTRNLKNRLNGKSYFLNNYDLFHSKYYSLNSVRPSYIDILRVSAGSNAHHYHHKPIPNDLFPSRISSGLLPPHTPTFY